MRDSGVETRSSTNRLGRRPLGCTLDEGERQACGSLTPLLTFSTGERMKGDTNQPLERSGIRPALSDWQKLFSDRDPRVLFERIRENDMLDLFPSCAARIRERALLVDSQRVHDLCLARVAVNAQLLKGDPDTTWLAAQVDGAIDHALRQDQELDRSGAVPDEDNPHYDFLILSLAMHPTLACTAAVCFNALPSIDRERFFSIFDGNSIDQTSALGLGSREEIGASMRTCLMALKYLDPTVIFKNGVRQ